MKKVLLTTVCGPFGMNTDDCTEHVMPELFHAQVTRSQGIFSPRVTYIAYGLEYIAENIQSPATVLQYPTMKQFRRELRKEYEYVGINFVIATFEKMKKMCSIVREVSPSSEIILGGYGTMLPECEVLGDHICREEGVGFMRRLLQEPPVCEPLRHVVYPTKGTVAGVPAMKGAVVLAGLGCPHGCEFCATSHYHKRRHIPLLKTGRDLHREIRRVHASLGNANLPIGIIEEDFLMQRARAKEYLECVKNDTGEHPIKISCFASAAAVSQWDPDDLVRMGIEAVWIGVESAQATYSKLKGLDMQALFRELHSRGINTLASLILGHDYHTVESVWEDFEYLISLEPSLSQFLILTPACSTPLFDRLRKEGLLLDVPHIHWDGFHLVFDHPNIGKHRMEELILEVYDEEYRRLGPSVVRYVGRQLQGYLRFRNSADPLLKARARQFRQGCVDALPLFVTAARKAPSQEVAERIECIRKQIVQEIGAGGAKNRILSGLVPVAAFLEGIKLRFASYPRTPMQRTEYRLYEGLLRSAVKTGKGMFTIRPRPRKASHHPIIVDLDGFFDRRAGKKLKKKVDAYLQKSSGRLAINFKNVSSAEKNALFQLLKRLRSYKERIQIVSIDSLQADMADVTAYARCYFEVFLDVEGLSETLAVSADA